ncbi:alpha-keto acid decarboxylase family protein [uncultured Clostridium sp.]|uniref:alpha-keto acid decarboxylase family protein n=1 Tax=uncultured Clostridium sp. TaxID=59620 RepID=UPI0026040AA9|nr:alpha-keto acid decarboxylase family protein [uncultured Clostridium sp.]
MKKTVGDYLIESLKSYGVEHIFGVPGDYNLSFLDQIDDAEGIDWIGNCNELNASYAADGYGRIKGMAAIATTFGVGELSAVNGIAGSYAESVPVVKIVGIPSANAVENRKLVHHTLGDGDFYRFNEMFKEVTIAQTMLNEINAKEEIDRVLRECYLHKKPVYIGMPVDLAKKEIFVSEKTEYKFESDNANLAKFIEKIQSLMTNSKKQMILADFEVNRLNLNNDVEKFVEKSNLPIASLAMGKGVIDETHKNFVGIYNGALSNENINALVKECDLAFLFGVKLTDSLTAGFSFINPNITLIEVHPLFSRIGDVVFTNIFMKDVLKALSNLDIKYSENTTPAIKAIRSFTATDDVLTQNRFFQGIESLINKNDVLIAEQGTSFFGACTVNLQSGCTFVGQPLWGSIGYTVGATLGTQMADKTRRNILLVGDGSFQLTAQEISTMIRENLSPIVMVVNNDGYTVERLIHGPNRKYNDINMWDYSKLVSVFDMEGNKSISLKIKTEKDLINGFKTANENKDKLIFMEVYMGRMDSPQLLKDLGELFSKQNSY